MALEKSKFGTAPISDQPIYAEQTSNNTVDPSNESALISQLARNLNSEQKQRLLSIILQENHESDIDAELNINNNFDDKIKDRNNTGVSTLVTPNLSQEMRRAAKRSGQSKQEWLRRVIEKAVGQSSSDDNLPTMRSEPSHATFDPDAPKDKSTLVRMSADLAEHLAKTVNDSGASKNDWVLAAITKAMRDGLNVKDVLYPAAEGPEPNGSAQVKR